MKSYTNRHGRTVHYDDRGQKIGESYQSASGRQVTHYDGEGRRTGRSYGDPNRRLTHYDGDGNRTGTSYTASPGRMRHYDAAGNHTADTWKSFFGAATRPVQPSAPREEPQPEAFRQDRFRQEQTRQEHFRQDGDGSTGCAVLLLLVALGLILLIGAALR